VTGPRPVELHWRLPVARPALDVWTVVSDTDRFNRAAGLDLTFREEPRDDGPTLRHASLRRFGIEITWQEKPFEFRAPEWFFQERLLDNGPVARSTVECHVESVGSDASVIDYRVQFFPRRTLLRPVVFAEVRLSTRASLERALTQMVALLEGRPNTYDAPPAPLAEDRERQLVDGLRDVQPAALSEALVRHIQSAPLPEQARLRPLAFADRLGLEDDVVVHGFLDAVRAGVLELSWELLCPSCLAPKADQHTLDIRPGTVHCASCNIRYDGTFPDSVDVVFRPASHLRDTDVPVACLLSPGRTPHVLAQRPVEPQGVVEWALDLPPGGYRLVTDPSFGAASIEVRDGVRADRITVDLTARGIRPAALRVGPGIVHVRARNTAERVLHVHLERAYRPPYTLTAGRLFEVPGARDLLPPDAVAPGIDVAVRSGWVVALCQVALAREGASDTGAFWDEPSSVVGNGTLIRVFDTLDAALAFAEPNDGDPEVAGGIAGGPVVWLETASESMPTGQAVDDALAVMRAVGGGTLGIHVKNASEVEDALDADRGRLTGASAQLYRRIRFQSAARRHAEALERQRSAPDPVPASLGPYRVRGELGRGGMGRVLDAVGPEGRVVVLKVLLPELARDPSHTQRFYNEAEVTRAIDHPNIVKVFDYGLSDAGEMYMVMERLDGRELEEALSDGPIDIDRVKTVGRAVLEALQAAHTHGVVHRDVKPANIFLLDDGQVKVIDFGIAHEMDADDPLAEQGIILGSPRYMSPEQVARDPLDGRTDLYSAALVLYECLAGDIPFSGDDVYALALARLSETPRPLSDATAVPPDLEEAIMRALEVDPPRRWATAEEMANALDG
jgi:predicted Ser/Thr protein kinase